MYAKDIIKHTLDTSDTIVRRYVGDLDQAEMTARPASGMNPIAWQIGHLLFVEKNVIDGLKPGASPPLPEGFDAAHGKDAGLSDDTSRYATRDEYLKLFAAQRDATKRVLDELTEDDLAAEPPNTFGGMCPTKGHLINFLGAHVLMHVGQFVPVRRNTGKPVVI